MPGGRNRDAFFGAIAHSPGGYLPTPPHVTSQGGWNVGTHGIAFSFLPYRPYAEGNLSRADGLSYDAYERILD